MHRPTSSTESNQIYYREKHSFSPPATTKTCGFAIAIIFGIGGLVAGGIGIAGFFQVGALSNMTQITAINMMAAGGVGAILLIIGIVGTVKNNQPHKKIDSDNSKHKSADDVAIKGSKSKGTSVLAGKSVVSKKIDTKGGTFYGPEAWPVLGEIWGYTLEVVDKNIPPPPKNAIAEGRIRIYIPEKIKVNGVEKDLTVNTLKEICSLFFGYFDDDIKAQLGNQTAPGWIDIDKGVHLVHQNPSKYVDILSLQQAVENTGDRFPHILEATVLNLIVHAFTKERLYRNTYAYCGNIDSSPSPVIVGNFSSALVICLRSRLNELQTVGLSTLRKYFVVKLNVTYI